MDYRIAIPSYKRADIIQKKTLKYLQKCNIPHTIIDIFVANKNEYEEYKKSIPNNLYNNIIITEVGLDKARKGIRDYYPAGANVFHLDDDIECLQLLRNKELIEITELDKYIKFGFKLMRKERTKLCGIYAVQNHFFMDNSYSKGLYFCVGSCYWQINDKDPYLDLICDEKEDYQRTIKSYIKYGSVLRFNNITAKTDYYITKGGMQENRSLDKIDEIGKYLIKKYPQYVRKNTSRKKRFEILFKRQKKNVKVKL